MELLLVRHLWGIDLERGFGPYLERWRKVGYGALEGSTRFVPKPDEMLSVLKNEGFRWIPQVLSNMQIAGGSVETHLQSFREQIEEFLPHNPLFFNAHSGSDAWSDAQVDEFYGKVVEMESEYGTTVAHETHRSRVFNNPWTTARVLKQFPALKLTCDFSHWVVVAERLLPDCDAEIRLAAQHAAHLHARVGYEQGPQVPDPRAPEWQNHLLTHETWWDIIFDVWEKSGRKPCTLTPEFGPPPYLHTAPFTQVPVADLADICDWMAQRQVDRARNRTAS